MDVGDVDGRVEGGKSGLVLAGEKGQTETVEFFRKNMEQRSRE